MASCQATSKRDRCCSEATRVSCRIPALSWTRHGRIGRMAGAILEPGQQTEPREPSAGTIRVQRMPTHGRFGVAHTDLTSSQGGVVFSRGLIPQGQKIVGISQFPYDSRVLHGQVIELPAGVLEQAQCLGIIGGPNQPGFSPGRHRLGKAKLRRGWGPSATNS